MSGQAGAQISSACTDDYGVDAAGVEPALDKRALSGLRGKQRRMGEKALRQRVRVNGKHFVERFNCQSSRLDAVIALQHGARNEVRARIEPREPLRGAKRFKAFRFGVPRVWGRGGDGAHVHLRLRRAGSRRARHAALERRERRA